MSGYLERLVRRANEDGFGRSHTIRIDPSASREGLDPIEAVAQPDTTQIKETGERDPAPLPANPAKPQPSQILIHESPEPATGPSGERFEPARDKQPSSERIQATSEQGDDTHPPIVPPERLAVGHMEQPFALGADDSVALPRAQAQIDQGEPAGMPRDTPQRPRATPVPPSAASRPRYPWQAEALELREPARTVPSSSTIGPDAVASRVPEPPRDPRDAPPVAGPDAFRGNRPRSGASPEGANPRPYAIDVAPEAVAARPLHHERAADAQTSRVVIGTLTVEIVPPAPPEPTERRRRRRHAETPARPGLADLNRRFGLGQM